MEPSTEIVANATGEIERDEPALIARIRRGEKALFHQLIRPYERGLYLAAYAVLRNPADAEEVAQETALKALANLGVLRSEESFKSWLLRIAVNEAKMRRRKDRRNLYESLDDPQDDDDGDCFPRQLADWREIPSEVLERKEVRQAVQTALESLPEAMRQVFVLRDVQQLNVRETAALLGIGIPSVKTRLHRARMRMREQLGPLFRKRWSDRLPFRKGNKPW